MENSTKKNIKIYLLEMLEITIVVLICGFLVLILFKSIIPVKAETVTWDDAIVGDGIGSTSPVSWYWEDPNVTSLVWKITASGYSGNGATTTSYGSDWQYATSTVNPINYLRVWFKIPDATLNQSIMDVTLMYGVSYGNGLLRISTNATNDIRWCPDFMTCYTIADNVSANTWHLLEMDYKYDWDAMTISFDSVEATTTVNFYQGAKPIYGFAFRTQNALNGFYFDELAVSNIFLEEVETISIDDYAEVTVVYDEDNPFTFDYWPHIPCYINDDCGIQIGFWPLYDDGSGVDIYYFDTLDIATSGVLMAEYGLEMNHQVFLLPQQTSTGTVDYIIDIDRTSTSSNYLKTFSLLYLDESQEQMARELTMVAMHCAKFNEDHPADTCVESDNWISCGFKKLFDWAVTLDTETCTKFFSTAYYNQTSFPWSVIYEIRQQITDSNTATSSGIHVPLKWYNTSTKQYEDTGVDLLGTSTLRVGMGETLYNFYYSWFKKLIYLFGLIYILFRTFRVMGVSLPGSIREFGHTERQRRLDIRRNTNANIK